MVVMTSNPIREVTLQEFHSALLAQGASSREDIAVVCPRCGTVQTARDLIEAGAGKTFDEVEKFLGFSCVGRWTRAGTPRPKPDGRPCNWTLGGLFSLHKLVVVATDGERHPRFEPATPEQSANHAKRATEMLAPSR